MRIFLNAKIALQRKIAWLLIFSLFTLFFVGWLIYFSKKNIETTTSWIDHAYSVIQQIEEIKVHLSGWQQPDRQGSTFYETLGHDRKRIQQLTVDNPDQQTLIGQLSAQLFELKTGDNRRVLNAMNSTLDQMMQQERDLLYKRQLNNEITDTRINILLIGASLLAFSFIVIILLRLNRTSSCAGRQKAG